MTDTDTSHNPRAFDLGELVTRLRQAGYRTDTRQYLSAHQLILVLARQGIRLDQIVDFPDAEKLAACLAPVFCHSPEEQTRFKDIITQWLAVTAPQPSRQRRQALKEHRDKIKTTVAARPVRAFVAMALLVMAAVVLFYYFVPVTATGRILRFVPESQKNLPAPDARVLFEDDAVALNPNGGYAIELTRFASPGRMLVQLQGYQELEYFIDARLDTVKDIVLQPNLLPPPPGGANGIWIGEPLVISPQVSNFTIVRKTQWPKAIGIPAAAAGALFLFLVLAGRVRRRLVLKRLPVSQRPDLTSLTVADAPAADLTGPQLRRLVGALRRPRKEEVFELSAFLTARATARAAGMFSPVWQPRRRMPEYIALIDRKCAQDHHALMFDDLLKRLEQSDVAITRYYFRDDPRICRRADDPLRQWLLSELTVIHHACRLIICADADQLLDPMTGAPAPWTTKLKQWSRRVLFTSLPPYHWTALEWSLAADGMVVLPATVQGLLQFAELPEQWRIESLFPAPYARAYPSLVGSQGLRWLDRSAPPDDITKRLMGQFRDYLGPSGFAWLCACAVYPEINWSLTRYLEKAVFDVGPGGTDRNFTGLLCAMARLPWFRYGYMPDWLRSDLLRQFSVDREKKVRRHLETLLTKMARQHPKAAGGDGLKVAGWITPRDLMTTSPREDSLADTVFVGFMSGAGMDRLAVQAPSAFKGLFRRLRRLPGPGIPSEPRSFGYRLSAWFRGLGIWHKNALRISIAGQAGLLALALAIPYFTDVQEKHIDTIVHDIAYNPDGTRLASGSWDNSISLWDPGSGKAIGKLIGHSNYVTRLFFSADGTMLASGSWDRSIRLWNIATATELAVLQGHTDAVYSVAFSPDSRLLASASGDMTVRLWNAGTYEQKAVLTGHGDFVSSVAISPEGRTLASGSGDKTIRLWDIDSGRTIKVLEGHNAYVSTVAFSPNGKTLASGSGDKTVRLWDLQTGRQTHILEGHEDYVSTVTFSPDSKFVASSGSKDKSIRLWDAVTGESVRVLQDFAQMPVLCVAFNPQETALAAGEWGKIFIWPVNMQTRNMDVGVPDVRGMSLDRARQELMRKGLKAGRIQFSPARGLPDTVAAQEPRAGSHVRQGTEIALTVVITPSYSRPLVVPDLIGLRPEKAAGVLQEAGLKLGGTEFGWDGKSPEGTIIKQNPSAQTKVKKGASVIIIVNRMVPSSRRGYCCAEAGSKPDQSVGEVFQSDEATCRQRSGSFFRNQKEAEAVCAKKFSNILRAPSPPTSITIQ